MVILGILASIVIPNFTRSTDEAKTGITYSELMKIRRHVEMFRARNAGALPAIIDGSDGNWGALVGRNSEYLQGPPTNAHVGGANGKKIRFGTGPDSAFQTDYGWIVDPATGNVWAGSFDGDDRPLTP